jgi:hypothetical protein
MCSFCLIMFILSAKLAISNLLLLIWFHDYVSDTENITFLSTQSFAIYRIYHILVYYWWLWKNICILYNDKQTELLRMAMKNVICEVHVTVSTYVYSSMNVEVCFKYKHFIAIIPNSFVQISLTEILLQPSASDIKWAATL